MAFRTLVAALLLMGALLPSLAWAGLSVSPVNVEFAPGQQMRTIEVSNPGGEAMQVQVRLFAWRTDEAGDHHEPSNELLFSPPMFTLAPGARQTIRLLAPRSPAEGERAYRLYVDQLPAGQAGGGLEMPVRMVLPVFVTGPTRGEPQLEWRMDWSAGEGQAVVTAVNRGSRRVRLVNLGYEASGERRMIAEGLSGYVLAGGSRSWRVPLAAAPGAVVLQADSDQGRVQAPVRVAVP